MDRVHPHPADFFPIPPAENLPHLRQGLPPLRHRDSQLLCRSCKIEMHQNVTPVFFLWWARRQHTRCWTLSPAGGHLLGGWDLTLAKLLAERAAAVPPQEHHPTDCATS